jgi:hypothetical protein
MAPIIAVAALLALLVCGGVILFGFGLFVYRAVPAPQPLPQAVPSAPVAPAPPIAPEPPDTLETNESMESPPSESPSESP